MLIEKLSEVWHKRLKANQDQFKFQLKLAKGIPFFSVQQVAVKPPL